MSRASFWRRRNQLTVGGDQRRGFGFRPLQAAPAEPDGESGAPPGEGLAREKADRRIQVALGRELVRETRGPDGAEDVVDDGAGKVVEGVWVEDANVIERDEVVRLQIDFGTVDEAGLAATEWPLDDGATAPRVVGDALPQGLEFLLAPHEEFNPEGATLLGAHA